MGKSSFKLEEKNVYKYHSTMTYHQNQQTSIIPKKEQHMERQRKKRKREVITLNIFTS